MPQKHAYCDSDAIVYARDEEHVLKATASPAHGIDALFKMPVGCGYRAFVLPRRRVAYHQRRVCHAGEDRFRPCQRRGGATI